MNPLHRILVCKARILHTAILCHFFFDFSNLGNGIWGFQIGEGVEFAVLEFEKITKEFLYLHVTRTWKNWIHNFGIIEKVIEFCLIVEVVLFQICNKTIMKKCYFQSICLGKNIFLFGAWNIIFSQHQIQIYFLQY